MNPDLTAQRLPEETDAAPRPKTLAELGEGAAEGDLLRVALKRAAG